MACNNMVQDGACSTKDCAYCDDKEFCDATRHWRAGRQRLEQNAAVEAAQGKDQQSRAGFVTVRTAMVNITKKKKTSLRQKDAGNLLRGRLRTRFSEPVVEKTHSYTWKEMAKI